MNKLIIESLKVIYEYDKDFFSYDMVSKDMWNELLSNEMKKVNIFFNLENNYSVKEQRIIVIPQKKWPSECKFKCELWQAGGDWEVPVYYFKIQLVNGYCYNTTNPEYCRSSFSQSYFIYIPGKKEGNYNLVRSGEKWGAPNGNDYVIGIDPESNSNKCWESLKLYLKDLVYQEIDRVNNSKIFKI